MERSSSRLHDATSGTAPPADARTKSSRPIALPKAAPKADVRLSARELVRGLARLVEGQRQLAQELGLKDERVFLSEHEQFRDGDVEAVLRRWLLAGPDGVDVIRELFDDLCEHQLALIRAVDGVALSALREHAPSGPMAWLQRARERVFGLGRVRTLVEDDQARFQRIVAPALACAYARAREADKARRRGTVNQNPALTPTGDS